MLRGQSEFESRDSEIARATRAPASTSFPAANSFACSRPAAIRKKCTFAGVGKSREEIEYALEQRVYSFNVESEAELEYIDKIAASKGVRAPIALRANPDVDPHTHEYISTGSHENKFGIALDHAAAVYERAAKMRNIDIVGVQMHIGSQITETEPFADAIRKVAPLVRELKSKYGIEFFSIGGGLGIVYESSFASGSGSGKWWHEQVRRIVSCRSSNMSMRFCRRCAISVFASCSNPGDCSSATPAFC